MPDRHGRPDWPSPCIRLLRIAGLVLLTSSPTFAAFTNVTNTYGLLVEDRMSWGATFVDVDGDGDVDLYIGNHWRDVPQLFRNDGGGVLTDIGAHYVDLPKDRHDQVWIDLDGNGAPDQYMIKGGNQASELWWNDADGFVEGAVAAGADDDVGSGLFGRGREITLADFDADGAVDIYIANAFRSGFDPPGVFLRNNGDRTFTRIQKPILDQSWSRCSSADFNGDGLPDLILTNPFDVGGYLMRNDGGWNFTDVTANAFPGIVDPLARAHALSWADYDEDGDLDLFAGSGDAGRWDYAAQEGDSLRYYSIVPIAETETVSFTTDADSIVVFAQQADYAFPTCHLGASNDSATSYPFTRAVAAIVGEPPALLLDTRIVAIWSVPGTGADTIHVTVTGDSKVGNTVGGDIHVIGGSILDVWTTGHDPPPPQATGDFSDRLFRNEGNGTFFEVSSTAFPAVTDRNACASAWGDYDNDGWLDLFIANSGTVETLNEPNRLWRNQGDGTFVDVSVSEGVEGPGNGMSSGGTWGDIDGDGVLDLFVNHGLESPPIGIGPRELLRGAVNSNHWFECRLRGSGLNGSGVGATIRIVSAAGARSRTVHGDSDNAFSAAFGAHFGLGADTTVDTLQVNWASGAVDIHTTLSADTRWMVVEGESTPRLFGAPSFAAAPSVLNLVVAAPDTASAQITIDNLGAETMLPTMSIEDCTGQPAPWLSTSLGARIWPGDAPFPVVVTVDTASLGFGLYCGRVIVTASGAEPETVVVNIDVSMGGVGVSPSTPRIAALELRSPRPNPTRGDTHLALGLPREEHVRVAVFDVNGRVVRNLVNGTLPAGWHDLRWDRRDGSGRRTSAGVYWIRATSSDGTQTRRVVLLD